MCWRSPTGAHGGRHSLQGPRAPARDPRTTRRATALLPLCSFPLPRDDAADDGDYELKMLGALRAVNIDNNAVGWYQSSYLGSYCTKDTITHQLQYQETLPKSVMLIYDGVKTSQGTLSIKALRLTDAFCDAYRGKRVPAEA